MPTEDAGIRRNQTEADGSRKMAGAALKSGDFRHIFGTGPVGFPDMLPRHRHHGPQTCFHQTHGPEATRNASRRNMAEAGGSRRKLTGAENGRNSTRIGRFPPKVWPRHVGFPDMPPDIIIMGPKHVSIRHTGQKRPGTDADGRWRKQPEADGS